jgi:putative protease
MPYSLISNYRTNNPLQLFSPSDFAALPLLEQLVATGINSLKIEGRLKPAEYVAEVTRIYRKTLDTISQKIIDSQLRNQPTRNQKNNFIDATISSDMTRLELIFSRGLSTGWLGEVDLRELVSGNIMSHRGVEIGKVIEVRRDAAVVRLSGKIQRGDGVMFENKEQPENSQGGRVYEIIRNGMSVQNCDENVKVLLTFANDSIDSQYVKSGQSARKTNDPEVEREIRKSLESKHTQRRVPIDITLTAIAGQPLKLSATTPLGATCEIICNDNLQIAVKHPITTETLQTQFDRLGDTIFSLGNLNAKIEGNPMIPLSVIGKLRREMIETLEKFKPQSKTKIEFRDNYENIKRKIDKSFAEIFVTKNKNGDEKNIDDNKSDSPTIHFLLREIEILEDTKLLKRIIASGCRSFYVELRKIDEYELASRILRCEGVSFVAVAPRIILPRENWFAEKFTALKPDAVLVRNCEELLFFTERNIPAIADFSFNVINELSFQKLLEWKAERITTGFDLNEERLKNFCEKIPKSKVELIIFGRVPLFTMKHCLWRTSVIPRGDSCNQICRRQPLKLKDRRGAIHSARSDMLCRNIIENAAEYAINPIKNVQHYRIEWDSRLGNPVEIIERIREYFREYL